MQARRAGLLLLFLLGIFFLFVFEQHMWASSNHIGSVIKNNNFGMDTQVELVQFNSVSQVDETRLLRHFSG